MIQTWSALGSGSSNGVNSGVLALSTLDGILYAGGYFDEAGDTSAMRIAKWNGAAWSALPGFPSNGNVYALASLGTAVYVGGDFRATNANYIAQWNVDTSTWSSLGNGMNSDNVEVTAVYALTTAPSLSISTS